MIGRFLSWLKAPRRQDEPPERIIGYATLLTDGKALAAPIYDRGRQWEADFIASEAVALQGVEVRLLLRAPDYQIGPLPMSLGGMMGYRVSCGERVSLHWDKGNMASFWTRGGESLVSRL